jgi:hypothetical protein
MKPNTQGRFHTATCLIGARLRAEASLGEIGEIFKAPIDALSDKRLVAVFAVLGCFGDRISTAGA